MQTSPSTPAPGSLLRRIRNAARIRLGRRGSVGITIAVLAVPMLAGLGLGIDLARAFLLHSRLVTAMDSAAIAGARSLSSRTVTEEVTGFFQANLPRSRTGETMFGASIAALDVRVVDRDVILSVEARMPTSGLLRVLGFDTVPIRVQAEARRGQSGLELAMVLDTTGSMGPINMAALRTAANTLVDVLYGQEDVVPGLWVSIVPYVSTVNLGPGRTDWLEAGSLDQNAYRNSSWAGCVEARHENGNDQNDAPPGAAPFRPFFAASTLGSFPIRGDNDWAPGTITPASQLAARGNEAVGPNLGCPLPVLPLTASRTVLRARIGELVDVSRGGTMANLGLQAGWFTLSPRWRGLWGGDARLPHDYRVRGMRKAMVLMTDGINTWHDWGGGAPGRSDGAYDSRGNPTNQGHRVQPWTVDADYTGYGRLAENRLGITITGGSVSSRHASAMTRAGEEINARMSRLCAAVKREGILVYTITFNLNNLTTQDLFRACATNPTMYFNSPDAAALQAAFRQIGEELASIRLTR